MFKSIGLNIDHPETFFVQQGRITQIVSFKPMEIMEMLMESAGVALYHEISDNTRGVMKEKSEKLDITQQRMKMNFGPKLKQLEKERAKLAEHESLQAQMSEKKGIETRLKKYQAQKTVKMGTETLKNYEKTLSENNKIKAFFKSQLDNLHKEAESDSGELKGIFKELGDLKAKTQEMKSLLATSTNEKSEKLREKNKKTDQIQNLRVKQAEKEKSLARAQATKESMEQLIERLKERLEGLAEEKQTMASKGESGSNSDDPSKPIASRIVRLKNDLLQRKDDLERTKNEIKKIQEYIKSGERSKQKIDQELKDYQVEEKELQEEVGKYKGIVD